MEGERGLPSVYKNRIKVTEIPRERGYPGAGNSELIVGLVSIKRILLFLINSPDKPSILQGTTVCLRKPTQMTEIATKTGVQGTGVPGYKVG